MPALTRKLTDTVAKSLNDCPVVPGKAYTIYWSADKDGLGVRVSSAGARAWVFERRVSGKTVRRTVGKVTGRRAISAAAARAKLTVISGELELGKDQAKLDQVDRRSKRQEVKETLLTLRVALADYVDKKERVKGGKTIKLKKRTKDDYLAMLEPGGTSNDGKPFLDGGLFSIADVPIQRITADDMRRAHAKALLRGQRQAAYAMQVLRAVLNWHGIKVSDNPLSRDVAGRDRIVLAPTTGDPTPIRPDRLGAWWDAACSAGAGHVGGSKLGGDYYRFQLLTGCRGVEILGDDYDNEPIRVRDVNIKDARILLQDTKNRKDHTLLLSRQALAIVKENIKAKKPGDMLFAVGDPRKTLQAINRAAGLEPLAVQGHDMRSTFISIADDLVSATTVKRMVNHADARDVTATHYVGKSEAQLRDGWQKVADFIASQAASVTTN